MVGIWRCKFEMYLARFERKLVGVNSPNVCSFWSCFLSFFLFFLYFFFFLKTKRKNVRFITMWMNPKVTDVYCAWNVKMQVTMTSDHVLKMWKYRILWIYIQILCLWRRILFPENELHLHFKKKNEKKIDDKGKIACHKLCDSSEDPTCLER